MDMPWGGIPDERGCAWIVLIFGIIFILHGIGWVFLGVDFLAFLHELFHGE